VKDLYNENINHSTKTLKKTIEDFPGPWIDRINIGKMAISPKAIYIFNVILIKFPMILITEIEKSTLKFIWKHKRPLITKAILSKKSNAGGVTILNYKLYDSAIAMKTPCHWHKHRHKD
jgi:hypothetical protein